ncbi:MAG: hypothetical protein C0507_09125 [Cyanobacteria bacterium PR.3.49]|nr:hypothetical protein [Cyanobacteria bacterium PR.3.49]
MNPEVSILLPVYNGSAFLESAIDSVLEQTFADFELIVCDDCSSDDSLAIIERKCKQDKRIKLFSNQKNMGLFANYNRCLRESGGSLIKPFAQDDLLHPHCLERMTEVLRNDSEISLVSCARNICNEDGQIIHSKPMFPHDRKIAGKDVILYNLIVLSNWVGEPSMVMYRRGDSPADFDTKLFHYGDVDMWFQILGRGDYYFVAENLAVFRRHDVSATSVNLSGLLFALDLVYLGKKHRRTLADFGETVEHYHLRVAEYAAMELDHLLNTEALTLDKILESAVKGARIGLIEPEEKERIFFAFIELNMIMMRSLTHTLKNLSDTEHRTDAQREDLIRKLENIENSSSWQLTAPMRELVARVKQLKVRTK